MDKIFFIGIARSGSKIYMNSLNAYSDINISLEMHWKRPFILGRDGSSIFRKKIKDYNKSRKLKSLLDFIYSNPVKKSSFFQNITIEKKSLTDRLSLFPHLSDDILIQILIEEDAKQKGKKTAGAKLPLNITYANWLIEKFPESKYILLVRDPRAIYSSMFNKDVKYGSKKGIFWFYIFRLARLFYVVQQYKAMWKFYRNYQDKAKLLIAKYEDLVISPSEQLNQICEFINIKFIEEMLYPPVKESSYDSKDTNPGIKKDSFEKWRKTLSKGEIHLIKLFLKKEMHCFGYY